jgi:nicotinamide-nucleotide amidase
MQPTINQIHLSLLKSKKSVSVAESCTGGLVAASLTSLPGSSGYFISGVVAYSSAAKQRILGIPGRVIAKKGAVSENVARLMAKNIRRLARTDFGIAVTGIAGPGGAVTTSPVGTVFIALAGSSKLISKRLRLRGSRSLIRRKSVEAALRLLGKFI